MKALLIGDIHIKINNFQVALKFLNWLNQLIDEQKPDLVINLGDTFDTHSVVRSEIMTEFMNHVNKVLALNIPYLYVMGNHDQFKPGDSKYHALKHLVGKVPNLYIVDTIQDLFGMTFVPYQHDGNNFPKKTLPICIAHQTFNGVDYGGGAFRVTEAVDPRSVLGAELIVSGHIHNKSIVEQILYVGSPFSQSASDIDQVKGITVLDTETYKQVFHPTPLPMWRRFSAEVSSEQSISAIHDSLSVKLSQFPEDHWVIELHGPKAELVGYLGSKQYKEVVKEVNIKVKTMFTDKEKKKISIKSRNLDDIIFEYVTKVYSGSVDKDKLTQCAIAILSESRLNK